jgi:GH18 family chitinase
MRVLTSFGGWSWGDVFESMITSGIKLKSFDKVNVLLNYTKLRNIQGFVQIYINEQKHQE